MKTKQDKKIEKFRSCIEKTNAFSMPYISPFQDLNESIKIQAKINYLIISPKTPEAEQKLRQNPYNRLLIGKNKFFCLTYFPSSIQKKLEIENLPEKYRKRLEYLFQARDKGEVELYTSFYISINEFIQMDYRAKKYIKEDNDYKKHKQQIESYKSLVNPALPYKEIKRVCLNYNTLLILKNANENGNNTLLNQYKDTKTFYTDCILNYLLEHSTIINKDFLKYPNSTKEVRISAKELKKLYPHRTFKLEAPEGVTITKLENHRTNNTCISRTSKNDTIVFVFSEEYIAKFKAISFKENSNLEARNSFIKIPMFFVLQALQRDNLTSNGFKFLLWTISYFRMSKPKIFHKLSTIAKAIGLDFKHGYKKPTLILNKYFTYLYNIGMLGNVSEELSFSNIDLDAPPKINGAFIELKKPEI